MENTWNFKYGVLNTFFTFFQTSMKYQCWLHPPSRWDNREFYVQRAWRRCILVDHLCHRSGAWTASKVRRWTVSLASPSGGTKGAAGQVQDYPGGSHIRKGAENSGLRAPGVYAAGKQLLRSDPSPLLSFAEIQLEFRAQCWAPLYRTVGLAVGFSLTVTAKDSY